MLFNKMSLAATLLASAIGVGSLEGKAADVSIATATDITSLDPQFHNVGPNVEFHMNIFDSLVAQAPDQSLQPGLATSWKVTDDDPKVWEFHLRTGVRFQDGAPLTAEDVVYSFERARAIKNSPGGAVQFLSHVAKVEAKEPSVVTITTKDVYPLLPNDLSAVPIISHARGDLSKIDYTNIANVVGTGPYKLASYTPGERAVLKRNESYWGANPAWDTVTIRPISAPAARTAALLAGDVDLIAAVSSADLTRLRENQDLRVWDAQSSRLIYLAMDSSRELSPFVKGPKGEDIPNPLRDRRVREAISLSINRSAIVDRIMGGLAEPSGQIAAPFLFGAARDIAAPSQNVERARALLAEAGYPDGFSITLHTPNDRYPNDSAVAQAVAQMLVQASIKCQVEAMPSSVYFTRASKLEFSLMLLGNASVTGEASFPLKTIAGTFEKDGSRGGANRGRYSNASLDALLDRASSTVADTDRQKLLQEADHLAAEDVAVVPLYFQKYAWATRRGVEYQGRSDEYTIAESARPNE
ncbi:MAG: ABC transporter substrate-binding protein [Mesorhizobium sp.]|nr:MAG: ABC transporter substrate-binding protein [Mesorhizobium sp.]